MLLLMVVSEQECEFARGHHPFVMIPKVFSTALAHVVSTIPLEV